MADSASLFRRIWKALREQRTGVVCALMAAALLALGSVLMDRYPERYRSLAMDDLRFFVEPPSFSHVWLYALAATMTVWAASAAVCTYESLRSRIRQRITRPSAYGAPLLHVTFVLGLLGHLWGGFSAESRRVQLGPEGAELHGARLTPRRIDRELHPNGQPRNISVVIERVVDGHVDEVELGYNRPLVFDAGAVELLLGRTTTVPVAELSHAGERVSLRPGQRVEVGGDTLILAQVRPPAAGRPASAEVMVAGAGRARLSLPLGGPGQGAKRTSLTSIEPAPALLLTERKNPSMPLIWITSLFAVLGVLLVAWERRRSAGTSTEAQSG